MNEKAPLQVSASSGTVTLHTHPHDERKKQNNSRRRGTGSVVGGPGEIREDQIDAHKGSGRRERSVIHEAEVARIGRKYDSAQLNSR